MTAAIISFFWVLSLGFMFWIGLKLGQSLSQKNYDDFEL
jgi:lipopolysaccharide export LptBFGC system permease protein LptF